MLTSTDSRYFGEISVDIVDIFVPGFNQLQKRGFILAKGFFMPKYEEIVDHLLLILQRQGCCGSCSSLFLVYHG